MTFAHKDAIPGGRRLRLGIAGPSRSGKTLSSLRIATGMAEKIGKPVFFIDTDNEFALDYAGEFKFQHVDFPPPHTSERYMEAIQYCVEQGAGVIVVDQISHEHTGEGGALQRQEETADMLAAKWKTSRDKVNQAAWNQAKTIPHGKFVTYVTRVKQPIIFNFRAKDKIKMAGKEIIHIGWTPICTEQFDYEMTAMLMLPPNSEGYPSKELSEIRAPLRSVFRLDEQLSEGLGQRLATWALGDTPPPAKKEFSLADALASLEPLGADLATVTKYLGHAPTASDRKKLGDLYRQLHAAIAVHPDPSGSPGAAGGVGADDAAGQGGVGR
jgi:hypothetical protein